MKENEIHNGDIVRIDYKETYTNRKVEAYDAVVLWKGLNFQPLIARLDELNKGEYRPIWNIYEHIAEVKGHIDLSELFAEKLNEQAKEEEELDR